MSDQKFIYILLQSQKFCARQKDYLHSVKLIFVPAQNAVKFFGVAQKIWIGTNYFGTCKGQGKNWAHFQKVKYSKNEK